MEIIMTAVIAIVACVFGYVIRKMIVEKQVAEAKNNAKEIILSAKKEAVTSKKEAILEAK